MYFWTRNTVIYFEKFGCFVGCIKKNTLDAFIIIDMSLPVVISHGSATQYLILASIHTTYFLNVSV